MALSPELCCDEMSVAISYGLMFGEGAPVTPSAVTAPAAEVSAPAASETAGPSKSQLKKAAKLAEKEKKKAEKEAAKKKAEAAKKAEAEADDDDMDDMFGDDDEADEAPKPKEKSMKEKLEEKKQAALERLAKKEAKQRSLCTLEIKPWDAEQDLLVLFKKLKADIVMDGLKWSENCALHDIAFGIKKIVLTAVINMNLSMDAIIEDILEGPMSEEIQSMEMTSMSLL